MVDEKTIFSKPNVAQFALSAFSFMLEFSIISEMGLLMHFNVGWACADIWAAAANLKPFVFGLGMLTKNCIIGKRAEANCTFPLILVTKNSIH